MNIRSVLCVGLALGAASLFAEVESSNVFGQIKCTTTFRKTMVAIPWVSTNATAQTIKVAEIIQTTNLDEGTMALHWNGNSNSWDAWQINGGAWETVTTASETGVTVSQNPTDAPIPRGTGIWLIRPQGAYNANKTLTFYVYGKYDKKACAVTCAANRSTIVCAPFASEADFDLNGSGHASAWSNVHDNDAIRMQTDTFPYYKEWVYQKAQGWGTFTAPTTTIKGHTVPDPNGSPEFTKSTDAVIPAGTAFWFVNRGNGDVTITWPGETEPSAID